MSASIFQNKTPQPNDAMLFEELGKSRDFFEQIRSFLEKEYGKVSLEWKYYGQSSGWVLKMLSGKRNALFVVPCKKYFRVALTFGEKAVKEVMASELPDEIKEQVFAAKKYAEGRTIQLDVKASAQCKNVLSLIKLKMDN